MDIRAHTNAHAGPSDPFRHTQSSSTSSRARTQETPVGIGADLPEPLTHVQAIYDFTPALLPSTAAAQTGVYLSFKAGDVIRVYARDSTGWWDGETASMEQDGRSGPRRGWFPSNYVREMGHDSTSHRRAESAARSESTSSPSSRRDTTSVGSVPARYTTSSSSSALSGSHTSRPSLTSHASNASIASRHTHASQPSHASYASQASRQSSSQSIGNDMSPSRNYMQSVSPDLQVLLHPILQALTLIDTAIHTNRKAHIQPAAAVVISAVREVLSNTDCLQKESSTLRQYPQLAKERKAILTQLSVLVGRAKVVGTGDDGDDTTRQGPADEEELARAGRSVFSRMKRFVLLCDEYNVRPKVNKKDETPSGTGESRRGIPFPTTSGSSAKAESSDYLEMELTRTRLGSEGHATSRTQETFKKRAASIGDLRLARWQAGTPPPPVPKTAGLVPSYAPFDSRRDRLPSDASTHLSANLPSASSDASSPTSVHSDFKYRLVRSTDSTSTYQSQTADDGDRREPSTPPSGGTRERSFDSAIDVLEAISQAEDALLSVIAAFIGHVHSHHIGSHPSSHANLIEMTRETVDCVRDLLTVVEAVGRDTRVRAHRPRDVESLRVAKDTLYEIVSRLVEGVELIGSAPFNHQPEEDYENVKQQLLSTATATLRASTDCVRCIRACIPQGSDSFARTPTPRDTDAFARQSTPRPPPRDAALVLRERTVGRRGEHTLSGLHRKASSLHLLQTRYQNGNHLDVEVNQWRREQDGDDTDEEEEMVSESNQDDDMTLRLVVPGTGSLPGLQRPPLLHINTSPSISRTPARPPAVLRTWSDDDIPPARSRSSSLTSSAPRRKTHRSPSRSADLDKFTSDIELPLGDLHPSMDRLSVSSEAPVRIVSLNSSSRSSGYSDTTAPLPTTPEAADVALGTDCASSGFLHPDLIGRPGFQNQQQSDNPIPVRPETTRPTLTLRTNEAPTLALNNDIRFWVSAHDYEPKEITFNSDGAMNGATLRVLVEKMTPNDGVIDPALWTMFFFTFRLFTTPLGLLAALIDRYDPQPPAAVSLGDREQAIWIEEKVVPVRRRIYYLLKEWLEEHWRADSDGVVLEDLARFNREVVSRTLPALAPRLEEAIRMRQFGGPPVPPPEVSILSPARRFSNADKLVRTPLSAFPPIQWSLPPTPIISKSLNSMLQKSPASAGISITDFDALELARQLAIMESKLFRRVAPEDLLQTGKKVIPELKALSTLSNQITGWVADNILNESDAKKRASLLKFYIKVADKCLTMNNFSTLFALMAGLNSSIVTRLKKTWDALSAKYKIMMERLQHIIDHSKNHAVYRARLREAEAPCLPFLGLILTDITFTSDGNADTRASALAPDLQLINHDKYNKLGKIASEFARYQEPYNFHELEVVQSFLRKTLAERGSNSLDALYRKSLQLEPRQGSEKISSAFEKPGWLGGRI